MKFKYLGTAAAEAIPSIFCKCENCAKAWKAGGKNIRTRSQAIVDGKIMIDFPADSYAHSIMNKIDLTDVHHYIFTHMHEDHFYPTEFIYLKKGYGNLPDDIEPYHIYGSVDIKEETEKIAATINNGKLIYHETTAFVPFNIEDYEITPLVARHGTPNPRIYIIKHDGKTMLYAHDTSYFKEETWNYLKESKPFFNFVSLDCTCVANEPRSYNSHMCLSDCERVKNEFLDLGLADSKTIFFLNHFSHNGKLSCYDDLLPVAKEKGFDVSYDGLEIEF